MTIKEAEQKIINSGGKIDVFWNWMKGQTMSLNPDGSTNVYDYDVDRFIRYKCDPKNEPIEDFD
jgi:hypothetical protein